MSHLHLKLNTHIEINKSLEKENFEKDFYINFIDSLILEFN